ncbi:FHA domain containing protein [Gloeothece citriformis PCC 7424]|uniref:FHA domain containing protein n=1 Tax=Gloeothece citriformis (strain PCC 7424) TaxID=65393 RepID=B7KFR4_GLOC7|nr:FHA domain-containing protein [Gloeothece citriformis]ACK73389.1 FHA domain containing protein [Gloeothece citriformis PCC 7424]
MIVCPNCDHQNPDGAMQCEACYTPLPAMSYCPNCGASVQSDSTFCGQCGYNLQSEAVSPESEIPNPIPSQSPPTPPVTVQSLAPEPVPPNPPTPVAMSAPLKEETPSEDTALDWEVSQPLNVTRLQIQTASLLHLQTNQPIEIPQGLSVIHIGKPNERVPPDIDVSGFPDSDIVSRIHGDIRVEGDNYYIEDTGSSNGTYINHAPLLPGNRHRLRPGDRIALGKGDKVTFIFQLS